MAIIEKKIKVSRLTDDEIQDLRDSGIDVPDDPEGEVTIKVEQKQILTGADQIARAAGNKLESPAKSSGEEETVALEKSSDLEDLQKENSELKEALRKAHSECPRCRWPVNMDIDNEPSEEEVGEFLKSVCACEPYRCKYEVFGDNISVTYKTLSVSESEAISEYIKDEASSYRSQTFLSDDTLMGVLEDILFFASIDHCIIGSNTFKAPPVSVLTDNIEKAKKAGEEPVDLLVGIKSTFKDVPFQVTTALKAKYQEFAEKVTILTARSSDPKYWRGHNTSQ